LIWSLDMRGKQVRRVTHYYSDRLTAFHDTLDEATLAILDEVLDRPAEPADVGELGEIAPMSDGFFAFMALSHSMPFVLSDARLTERGLGGNQGMSWAIADLERYQLAAFQADDGSHRAVHLCFGGLEIGEEFRRLAREWVAMGRPSLDRLVIAAYPRAAYPRAASLPPGRWRGLIEKEHAWFRW